MLGDWQVLKASRKRATGGDADGEDDEEKPVKKTKGPRKSAAKSMAKAAPQPVQPAVVPVEPAAPEGDGPEATAKAKPAVDLVKEFADKEPRKWFTTNMYMNDESTHRSHYSDSLCGSAYLDVWSSGMYNLTCLPLLMNGYDFVVMQLTNNIISTGWNSDI